jgi:hypothetical protein
MRKHLRLFLGVVVLAGMTSAAWAQPCTVPDNGSGTVNLPPPGCGYLSPNDVHEIINGLPPGTTIELDPIHSQFFNVSVNPDSMGGENEEFDSSLQLTLTGTGDLAGFARTLNVPIHCEVHTGARTTGDAVQTFPNEMVSLQGAIFGDPDFDQLQITGGTNLVGPSPGQTTLTRLGPPGSDFQVDSFFDIEYRIDFQGAPGSVLAGMGGVTQGNIHMTTNPSTVQDIVPAGRPWGLALFAAALLLGGGLLVRRRVLS